MHVAGSPLPKSVYYADVGYFADGTDLTAAGNKFAKVPAVAATTAPKSPAASAAFAGTSAPKPTFRQPGGFAYSVQKDVYADFLFSNDVGYLPDGTPMNKAGNAMNHPERIQADPHTNGSPLPRANFANDVGYLPDGTPMNRAGNALNHPDTWQQRRALKRSTRPAGHEKGNNMVFYAATNAAGAAGNVPSALACEKPNGLIPASAIKKPSRVVRAKTLSRMDRISPEPPLAQGSNDSPGLILQGHDIRRMCRDFPEPRIPEVPSHPDSSPEMVAAARLNQFLQVSGCTALVSVPSADPAPSTPFEDDWSSDGDSDSDAFDLRQYRYARSNPAAPTASSVAAPVAVLARKWRRAAASRATNVEDGLEDAVAAWSAVATGAPYVTSQGDRLLADASDDDSENLEKDERRDLELLQRMANALVEFYGLGEAKRAIRLKSNVVNVVMVTEEAWRLKERESQLDEPPLFWLRGNRVYDFHGDRGTVADFEADLLTREVEDDATCRSRRQKQGLLPFPFLPLPQKEKVEDDDGNDANRAAPKR
eukprot:s1015_g7.t1